MTKAELLDRWYRRVYIEGDLDAVDTLFTDSTRAAGLMDDLQVGPEDLKVFVAAMLQLVEDQGYRIVHTIEHGDWISALFDVRAVAVGSLKPVRLSGQIMVRFEGERIVEAYNNWDILSFFEQLGLLPEHSLELGMTGQKIA
ncbi:hypothetical protein Ga0609869_001881 [Rhodovulum iodosum]|uniref:SnoaL-like domain-containing protein n=1 Tax=Rhodovulum iodosum TaxID=68291 RepID=A0ABV3XTY5_9RHOB|nr:nuclear transport factor 2 family protein [Rhodovulum robiginosum]RSK31999.1 hypothetical protein EJA01_12180 [Rhodovulum robiginosum]